LGICTAAQEVVCADARAWDIKNEDTVYRYISQAVARTGVMFSILPFTPKNFLDSFVMHLVQR